VPGAARRAVCGLRLEGWAPQAAQRGAPRARLVLHRLERRGAYLAQVELLVQVIIQLPHHRAAVRKTATVSALPRHAIAAICGSACALSGACRRPVCRAAALEWGGRTCCRRARRAARRAPPGPRRTARAGGRASLWFRAATACVPAQHSAHLARVHALVALVQDQVGRLVVAAQNPLRACLLVGQSR